MESNEQTKKKNILLGISGSVASIKLQQLVKQLTDILNVNICIIPTQNSLHFVPDFTQIFNKQLPLLADRLEFLKSESGFSKNMVFAFTDADEWSSWNKRSDPVLHIELKKWADLMLVAPLDANTMAKFSNGQCDNLLTCIARAWDINQMRKRPIIVCPAMNTFMYNHPVTDKQLQILTEEYQYTLVNSVEKTLMCGDVGVGAMAEIDTIVDVVKNFFKA